jgi:hypothetical protein
MAGTEADPGVSRASIVWTGWVMFAALVIILLGGFNAIHGLVALLNDDQFAVQEDALPVFDFTAWGWIMLLFGICMVLVGLALIGARGWARIIAIVLAALNAIAQLVFTSAQPAWSILVIALDVVVIFALTARWDEVVAGLYRVPDHPTAPRHPEGRHRR